MEKINTAMAASGFAALGSEQRLTVLRALVRAGERGLPTGELGRRSGVVGSTLTHHLRTLVQAGLVSQIRVGRQIRCTAQFSAVSDLSEFLLAACCADASNETVEANNG